MRYIFFLSDTPCTLKKNILPKKCVLFSKLNYHPSKLEIKTQIEIKPTSLINNSRHKEIQLIHHELI